ncbi:hypothetical protein C8R44DRAFT_886627 [Mycena epipterygia]|nr:hypothetical protein C8R44DRAFT_886627 [Mycena epipterygia]
MQRSFILLLFLGFVRATLQNVTVDDTSPDIVYSERTFHCNTTSCPDEVTEGLFNQSATLTFGSIMFSFNGTAFYAFFDVAGACSIILDNDEIATKNVTLSGEESFNISQSDLANGPHTLAISPLVTGTIIALDHIIYTASLPDEKSHVGAIVGGVIGGIVLTIAALFAALFARRRKLILRRNQRKSAVLRGITARPDYKARADDGRAVDGTDMPT